MAEESDALVCRARVLQGQEHRDLSRMHWSMPPSLVYVPSNLVMMSPVCTLYWWALGSSWQHFISSSSLSGGLRSVTESSRSHIVSSLECVFDTSFFFFLFFFFHVERFIIKEREREKEIDTSLFWGHTKCLRQMSVVNNLVQEHCSVSLPFQKRNGLIVSDVSVYELTSLLQS